MKIDEARTRCDAGVVSSPNPKPEASQPYPDIQEILRKRREMLNRVKADLARVGKLQEEFEKSTPKTGGQNGARPN